VTLETIDIVIIVCSAIALLGIAPFVSREPAGHDQNTEDYFLAG
jgi:SSS family solute:Na+ symporter